MLITDLIWNNRYKLSKKVLPDCVFCGSESHLGSFIKTTATYDPKTDKGMPRPLQNTTFVNRRNELVIADAADIDLHVSHENCKNGKCNPDCKLDQMFREAERQVELPISEIRKISFQDRNRVIASLNYSRKQLSHPAVFKRSPTPYFKIIK